VTQGVAWVTPFSRANTSAGSVSRLVWVQRTYRPGAAGTHPFPVTENVADEVLLLSQDVAAVFNDLGVLMAVRGNVEEAERFYRRSLEIKQRLLAGDHPELALTRRNLAVLPAR
jgi:hypothetical protein